MPTTITVYNTFVKNTAARATEVNTNFDNHRGTLVPINPLTAASTDLTHDLGHETKRWNVGFLGSLDLETSTTGATLIIKGQTGNTTGAFEFLIEGVTAAVIDTRGFVNPRRRYATIGATATAFQIATATITSATVTVNFTTIASLHIVTTGGPVIIGVDKILPYTTNAAQIILVLSNPTTGLADCQVRIRVTVNEGHTVAGGSPYYQKDHEQEIDGQNRISSAFVTGILDLSAGTHNLQLIGAFGDNTANIAFENSQFYAYELI